MRGPLVGLFAGLILAGAIVAGCGGGGGGGSASVVPGRSTQGGNTLVQVSLVIPEKTSQGKRVPKYVSPSTKSVLIEILGPIPSPSPSATPSIGPNLLVATGYVNVNSSSCTTNTGSETCTVSIPAAITQAGTYGIAVITSDQPQTTACNFIPNATPVPSPSPTPTGTCVGNALGINIAEANITPGSTAAVPITLGGVPAFFQPVELVSGMVGGHNSNLQVFGSGQAMVSFELLDADKNIIIGPNPLQLTVVNPNPASAHVSVSMTPSPLGLYTMTITPQITPVGGQNLVTPAQITMSIEAALNSNFDSTGSTVPVTVGGFIFGLQILHSEVAVQNNSGQVLLYLDGNTSSPTYTVYGSGATQLGLAFDAASNLWVADPMNGELLEFGQTADGVTPIENIVYCSSSGGSNCTTVGSGGFSPSFIDIDANGDLFASNYAAGAYQFDEWTATTPGTVPSPLTTPSWSLPGSSTMYFCHVAADNTGHVYIGSGNYVGPTYALYNYTVGSSTNTVISAANINGVAYGQDGTLWYLTYGGGVSTVWNYNPMTSSSSGTSITGVAGAAAQGIAVDMLGNVYIADGTNPGVKEYTKASNYASSNLIGLALSPAGVAVFPNGLYGANHPVGLAQPTQSPIPIASPII